MNEFDRARLIQRVRRLAADHVERQLADEWRPEIRAYLREELEEFNRQVPRQLEAFVAECERSVSAG